MSLIMPKPPGLYYATDGDASAASITAPAAAKASDFGLWVGIHTGAAITATTNLTNVAAAQYDGAALSGCWGYRKIAADGATDSGTISASCERIRSFVFPGCSEVVLSEVVSTASGTSLNLPAKTITEKGKSIIFVIAAIISSPGTITNPSGMTQIFTTSSATFTLRAFWLGPVSAWAGATYSWTNTREAFAIIGVIR